MTATLYHAYIHNDRTYNSCLVEGPQLQELTQNDINQIKLNAAQFLLPDIDDKIEIAPVTSLPWHLVNLCFDEKPLTPNP